MNFGDRLKEERKRLGLTQANFARRVDVHRNTQINYEAGLRVPEIDYITAIEKVGVDTGYLLSGSHEPIKQLGVFSKLDDKALDELVLSTLGDLDVNEFLESARKIEDPRNELGRRLLIDALISNCPSLAESFKRAQEIDGELLSSILERLENVLKNIARSLPPEKKARVVVMLYRAFMASGKVDQKLIEDTIAITE